MKGPWLNSDMEIQGIKKINNGKNLVSGNIANKLKSKQTPFFLLYSLSFKYYFWLELLLWLFNLQDWGEGTFIEARVLKWILKIFMRSFP